VRLGLGLEQRRWRLLEAMRSKWAEVGVNVGGEAGHGLLRQLLRLRMGLRLRLRLGLGLRMCLCMRLLHEEELALELLVLGCSSRSSGRRGGGGLSEIGGVLHGGR
jgi:hypothetical protein